MDSKTGLRYRDAIRKSGVSNLSVFQMISNLEPSDRFMGRFADITTGIMGGMRGTGTATTNVPNPTPLQTALGVGSTLAGIYGAFNPRPLFG